MSSFIDNYIMRHKSITRNQKKRWKKRQTIPKQVLIDFWKKGLIYLKSEPTKGISLKELTDLLGERVDSGKGGPKAIEYAKMILENTIKEEMMPRVVKYKIRENKYKFGLR
jgi:hypothetical protein